MEVTFRIDVPLHEQKLSEAARDALCRVHAQKRKMEERWMALLHSEMEKIMQEDREKLGKLFNAAKYNFAFNNSMCVMHAVDNTIRCLDALRMKHRDLPWLQALPDGLRLRDPKLQAYLREWAEENA